MTSSYFRSRVNASLLVVFLILLNGAAIKSLGQAPSGATTSQPTEAQELIKAQKANEEAQAEYYRELTKKLKQPPPDVAPVPTKSFRQSMAENPASVVGVVGTILGALIVATVGLTTLYFNYRNSLKAHVENQFYEAMKRLGDESSPTMRASAAGLLALIAQRKWLEVSVRKSWPPIRLVRSKPYFDTAVNQLLAGLQLEKHTVGLDALTNAMQKLLPDDVRGIIQKLYEANDSLQAELGSSIEEFFVIRGCEQVPRYGQESPPGLWNELENSTGYDAGDLDHLLNVTQSWRKFDEHLRIFQNQMEKDVGAMLSANHTKLRATSSRLRANVALFSVALSGLRTSSASFPGYPYDLSFERLFFVKGKITAGANLSGINFWQANFNGVKITNLNLENSNFQHARLSVFGNGGSLRGAGLVGVQFRGAWIGGIDLTNAYIRELQGGGSELGGCNWWKANFRLSNGLLDVALLEELYTQRAPSFPTDLNDVHESVREFIENRKSTAEPEES